MFFVIQRPCFQEDAGRYRMVGVAATVDEAKAVVERYSGDYYNAGDFIIATDMNIPSPAQDMNLLEGEK